MTQQLAELLQLEQALRDTIRSFFREQGFVEVHTAVLRCAPNLDAYVEPMQTQTRGERSGWLRTSPEYAHKGLLARGIERIYELGPCFRAEEQGPMHRSEFTMLEWYRCRETVEAVMSDTEQLVRRAAGCCHASTASRFPGPYANIDLSSPWPRVPLRDAFREFADMDLDDVADDDDRFFRAFAERIEPRLPSLGAVFLTEWPRAQGALARPLANDSRYVERFEAYLAGVELCNGYGELTDAGLTRERLLEANRRRQLGGAEPLPLDEDFLRALELGLDLTSGNALGFDRLAMILAGRTELMQLH